MRGTSISIREERHLKIFGKKDTLELVIVVLLSGVELYHEKK